MRFVRRLVLVVTAAVAFGATAAACSRSNSPATPAALSPAIETAAAKASFSVVAPTFFPTSADRLTQAESDPVTPSLLHLTYTAGTTRSSATLLITESSGKMAQPETGGGRLVSKDASGFQLREGPDRQPDASSYNATGNTHTLIMIFRGEKPTDAGVEKLLASLEPVK